MKTYCSFDLTHNKFHVITSIKRPRTLTDTQYWLFKLSYYDYATNNDNDWLHF